MKTPPLLALDIGSHFRSFHRTAHRHGKFAVLLAGAALLNISSLHASVEDDVASTAAGAGSGGNVTLTNAPAAGVAATYTNGQVPPSDGTIDVTFTAGATYMTANFSVGKAYTFGSVNDLNATPINILNGNGTTLAPLTLVGGNSVAPNTSDLLYVASGATLTFSAANTQSLVPGVAGTSGNFNIAGTATISAPVVGGATSKTVFTASPNSVTKTGVGMLTLSSAANNYTGGTFVTAGTLATAGTATLGTGNVTVAGTSALTLASSVSFADTATLSFARTTTITLNNTTADTLATIVDTDAGAPALNPGTYNAAQLNAAFGGIASFTGTGSLTVTTAVVPEPSTWMGVLMAAGTLGLALRRRG